LIHVIEVFNISEFGIFLSN